MKKRKIINTVKEPKKYNQYKSFHLPFKIIKHFIILIENIESDIKVDKKKLFEIGISVLDEIISKSNYNRNNDNYENFCIPLDSRYLQTKYGNNYSNYTRWLSTFNVIWKDFPYENKTSYFYLFSINNYNFFSNQNIKNYNVKYNNEYLNTYCLRNNVKIDILNTDYQLLKGIKKNRDFYTFCEVKIPITDKNKKFLISDYENDSTYINNAPNHIKKMGAFYRKNLNINKKEAVQYTVEKFENDLKKCKNNDEINLCNKKYLTRISSINAINNGKKNKTLRFSRNSTNKRVDTNLTNMASDLRPFIVGYDKMAYLDLVNSQPVLFNIVLKDYYKLANENQKLELDKYKEITSTGKWYEFLEKVYNFSRNEAKKTWMEIAYSQNKSYKKKKLTFANEFPYIYSIIEKIKEENHAQFAIKLQLIESNIFIDKICKLLVNKNIIPYTMHDGLLVPKINKEQTFEIMNAVFQKELGFIPVIKII